LKARDMEHGSDKKKREVQLIQETKVTPSEEELRKIISQRMQEFGEAETPADTVKPSEGIPLLT